MHSFFEYSGHRRSLILLKNYAVKHKKTPVPVFRDLFKHAERVIQATTTDRKSELTDQADTVVRALNLSVGSRDRQQTEADSRESSAPLLFSAHQKVTSEEETPLPRAPRNFSNSKKTLHKPLE